MIHGPVRLFRRFGQPQGPDLVAGRCDQRAGLDKGRPRLVGNSFEPALRRDLFDPGRGPVEIGRDRLQVCQDLLRPGTRQEILRRLGRTGDALRDPLEIDLLDLFYDLVDARENLADLGRPRRNDGEFGGEVQPGRQIGLLGVAPVQLDEDDAGDPRDFQRGHRVLFHVLAQPDLHDDLDEPVVGCHPDLLHAPHVHTPVFDGGVPLEALHGFVEVGGEADPLLEVLRGADPDDGGHPEEGARGHENAEGPAGNLSGHRKRSPSSPPDG